MCPRVHLAELGLGVDPTKRESVANQLQSATGY